MPYNEYKSRYTYKGTDVLINKLNIKNQELLDKFERVVTTYNLSKLYIKPTEGNFDLDHLCSIHKYLFGSLYDFAGEIRDECIQKGSTLFCRPGYIYPYSKTILEEMKKRIVNIECEEDLIKYLAHYYSELNIIHPFRDGNGRTIREFLRQYVLYINTKIDFGTFEIDFTNTTEEDKMILLKGSEISAITTKTELLEIFFAKTLIKKTEKRLKHL